MNVAELKKRLDELPDDMEVYALNVECRYRRVESVEIDDHYPDALIITGDEE